MLTIHEAAERRAAGVAAPADRPSHRRSDEHGLTGVTRARHAQMSLRAAGEDSQLLSFTGYASTYEDPYEMYDMFGPYTEVVSRGAAAESLNRIDLDVPLVLDHDSMRRIASTTTGTLMLSEDEIGLLAQAPALDPEDHDVAYIAPKMRAGLIHEMSFRFRIIRGMWSPDYTEYRIDAFDIHRGDVAIVGYGANPGTSSSLRDDTEPRANRGQRGADLIRDFDVALRAL
jgi:HK97 family phage prohead protease